MRPIAAQTPLASPLGLAGKTQAAHNSQNNINPANAEWRDEMRASRPAASGNTFPKVLFSLGAMVLVFAPSAARPQSAQDTYDFQICNGYFALCAASTCTPTMRPITIRTAAGGTRVFQEADCTCPVLFGQSIANLAGGNMQGSCQPPGPGQIWSSYQATFSIPQALTNWVTTLPESAAPPLFCPKTLNLGNQFVQCFSLSCDSERWINNVPVVTCHCPIGASQAGTRVAPQTAFASQAGQGDEAFCHMHPVAGSISLSQ
jgi:hypothetical protein